MKSLSTMGAKLADFRYESAKSLAESSLKHLSAEDTARRYPQWVTDSEYAFAQDHCQYVVDTDWKVAVAEAGRLISELHSDGIQQIPRDLKRAEIEAKIRPLGLPVKTERAALSLVIDPIHVVLTPAGTRFENGNHRATVLGRLHPDLDVPVIVQDRSGK